MRLKDVTLSEIRETRKITERQFLSQEVLWWLFRTEEEERSLDRGTGFSLGDRKGFVDDSNSYRTR